MGVKGSTVTFAALLQTLLKEEKLAIARATSRQGAQSRFAALLPQAEELDENNNQITPPGLHLVWLPYADDIRNLTLDSPKTASPEQVKLAKHIVRKLRIRFDPLEYQNPALQRHYACLQALALERETIEETPDLLLPDEEGMEPFKPIIEEFRNAVFPHGLPSSSKRKMNPPENGPSSKRQRVEDLPDLDWVKACETGYVETLKVDQLKAFLRNQSVHFSSKSRKADLITAVKAHVLSNAFNPTRK